MEQIQIKRTKRISLITPQRNITTAKPKQTKHKEINDVAEIFQQVDDLFKRRKTEVNVIKSEIENLTQQLQYLEKQTLDQSQCTAANGAAVAITRSKIEKLQQEYQYFQDNELNSLQEAITVYNICSESAMSTYEDCNTILLLFLNEMKSIHDIIIPSIGAAINDYNSNYDKLETTLSELTEQCDQLSIENKKDEDAIIQLKTHSSKVVEASQAKHKVLLILENEFRVLTERHQRAHSALQDTNSKQEQLLLEIANNENAICVSKKNRTAEIAERGDENDALNDLLATKQRINNKVFEEYTQQQKNNELLLKHIKILECDKEFYSNACSNSEKLLRESRDRITTLTKQLKCRKLTLKQTEDEFAAITQDGERQYNRTCELLKELKDKQVEHSILQVELHSVTEQLNKLIADAKAAVVASTEEVDKAQNALSNIKEKVAMARSELDGIDSDILMYSSRVLSLQSEISQLEHTIQQLHTIETDIHRGDQENVRIMKEIQNNEEQLLEAENTLSNNNKILTELDRDITALNHKIEKIISNNGNSAVMTLDLSSEEQAAFNERYEVESKRIRETVNQNHEKQINDLTQLIQQIKNKCSEELESLKPSVYCKAKMEDVEALKGRVVTIDVSISELTSSIAVLEKEKNKLIKEKSAPPDSRNNIVPFRNLTLPSSPDTEPGQEINIDQEVNDRSHNNPKEPQLNSSPHYKASTNIAADERSGFESFLMGDEMSVVQMADLHPSQFQQFSTIDNTCNVYNCSNVGLLTDTNNYQRAKSTLIINSEHTSIRKHTSQQYSNSKHDFIATQDSWVDDEVNLSMADMSNYEYTNSKRLKSSKKGNSQLSQELTSNNLRMFSRINKEQLTINDSHDTVRTPVLSKWEQSQAAQNLPKKPLDTRIRKQNNTTNTQRTTNMQKRTINNNTVVNNHGEDEEMSALSDEIAINTLSKHNTQTKSGTNINAQQKRNKMIPKSNKQSNDAKRLSATTNNTAAGNEKSRANNKRSTTATCDWFNDDDTPLI